MALFTGQDLTCHRGGRIVFAGLGFTIDAGGALELRGPNGSGKSTLLRLMAGLLLPAAGGLKWDEKSVAEDLDLHRTRCRYVGHLDAVKPVLTVRENLAFWAGLRDRTADLDTALETFGLSALADVPSRFLSSGQKRRLNLARLGVADTPLWLLDEPATGLDAASVEKLGAAIARHRDAGGLVVVSTHTELPLADAQLLDLGRFQPQLEAAS